jgi:hypothetical protein
MKPRYVTIQHVDSKGTPWGSEYHGRVIDETDATITIIIDGCPYGRKFRKDEIKIKEQ